MEDKYIKALQKFLNSNIKSRYAVVGSYNLLLHKIHIKPREIDIVTDDKGIKEISKTFNSNISEDTYHSKQTKIKINNIEIHCVSVKNNLFLDKSRLKDIEKIKIDNTTIPCSKIKADLDFYQKNLSKRNNKKKDKEKIKLIKDYLNKSNSL